LSRSVIATRGNVVWCALPADFDDVYCSLRMNEVIYRSRSFASVRKPPSSNDGFV